MVDLLLNDRSSPLSIILRGSKCVLLFSFIFPYFVDRAVARGNPSCFSLAFTSGVIITGSATSTLREGGKRDNFLVGWISIASYRLIRFFVVF